MYCPEIALHKSKTDESKREGDHGQKSKALGTIKRNGKEELLKGTVKLPYVDAEHIEVTDDSKKQLREAWLKA